MTRKIGCGNPEHKPRWVITVYRANYSAFNGGHYTPSDYSELECTLDGARWRTKAAYVEEIPLAQEVG